MNRRWLQMGLAVLLGVGVLFGLGSAAYLARVRTSATALIYSVREIRTKTDAEDVIANWRRRSGKNFWIESDHPGGDHNYDAQIVNLAIARFHVVEPTGVTIGITMRDGKLRCVTVVETTGRYPIAAVMTQEWFDEEMPKRFRVSRNRGSSAATVEFPATLPDAQRARAFTFNTNCLVRPGGCKSAEDILPGVWQLETYLTPD